jgi:predicted nucleic-acid-binding Zn-ribbon protein
MNKVETCPNCDSANMTAGSLSSTGNIYFRPEGAKFLNLHTTNVDVAASLCMDCGQVVLTADTAKVKALQSSA